MRLLCALQFPCIMLTPYFDYYAYTMLASCVFHMILFHSLPESWLPRTKENSEAKLKKGKNKDSLFYRSCIVSTVHAVIGIVTVVWWFCSFKVDMHNADRTLWGGVAGTGDEYCPWLLLWSLGYFIHDSILMIMYPSLNDISMWLHHIIISAAFGSCLIGGLHVPTLFWLVLEEFSTPFLNLKGLYKDTNPDLSVVFAKLFAVSFFLCRTVYGSYICYFPLYHCPEFFPLIEGQWFHLFQSHLAWYVLVLTRFLNLYWLFLIVRKAIANYKDPSIKQ